MCVLPQQRTDHDNNALSLSLLQIASRAVHVHGSVLGVRDCRAWAVSVYRFVFGFGLSSVGGFVLGFWLGAKLLYR